MMRRLIIPAAIFIIIGVGVTLALSTTVSHKSLTAREQDQVNQACTRCHEQHDLADISLHNIHDEVGCISCHDGLHSIHASAECQDCHAGTTGLKTADRAHDALQWVGIGIAGLVVATIGLNYFVSRRRLRNRGE